MKPLDAKILRVGLYTRVSTSIQVEEGFSLEAQHDRLMEYVRMQGWDLMRIYTDPGVSAKDLNRPGVKEMIADLTAGKFDVLLVHKLDRLTRNIGDLYELVELVNKHEVKLVSFSENIDTSTPMGRMFVYLLGIFAQMFRENLREEVIKGLKQRAEEGLRNTFAPLGYKQDEETGKLMVVPEEAEIVREVFHLYTGKKGGFTKIARILNNRPEYSGRRGGGFHASSIETILKNYTYIGKNHWKPKDAPEEQRIIRESDHEPIIDAETFELAQTIMQRRSNREMSRSFYDYPFTGILRCGSCGGTYFGAKNHYKKGNYDYYYYRCFNRYNHKGMCKQQDISEKRLEKLFFAHLDVIGDGLAFDESAASAEAPADDVRKARKSIERQLAQSETRRKNWQYAMGDGKLPYVDYVRLIDEEMLRVERLQEELATLPAEPAPKAPAITFDDVLSTLKSLRENWPYIERSTRKEFINALFKRIEIKQDGNKKWSITGMKWA